MKDERVKVLGFNIKIERLRKKYTQMQLAEIIDVHNDTIQKIENGKQNPSALILYDISKALGVTIDSLFKDIE